MKDPIESETYTEPQSVEPVPVSADMEGQLQQSEDEPGFWRSARTGVTRFFMRVAFVYFLLYACPFPLQLVPDVRTVPKIWHDSETPSKEVVWDLPEWVDSAYGWRNKQMGNWIDAERRAVDYATVEVFGFDEALDRGRGSGDATYSYIEAATRAVAAVAIALVWFLIAALISRFAHRRDRLLDAMGPWVHLVGRYYLASVLLSYGLAKVYPSQFSFPSFARLETPYGDGSPMNILWSFMGTSNGYIIFSGVMEVLPALLLFTRRTALLGALLGAAVMANVVLLNYCYDVPVKLLSTHLFVLAAALAAVDLRRLCAVFLTNRPAPPRDLSRPRTGWTGHVVRLLILVPYLGLAADRIIESYRHPKEPYELQGIWDVEEFLVDGSERIPRTDDALRFQAVIIDRESSAKLKTMDGSQRSVSTSFNKKGSRLTLGTESHWLYRLEGDELVLEGEHLRRSYGGQRQPMASGTPRDPQLELRLRRDANYVPAEGVRVRRSRVPEDLCGRWVFVSREFVGETATRRRSVPYNWEAIEVDADGVVRVQYPLSVQEFRIKAIPSSKGTEGNIEEDPKEPLDGVLTLRSTSKFDVERVDENIRLEGKLYGIEVEIGLRRRDPESFLLVRRGFHWLNEIPLNRY